MRLVQIGKETDWVDVVAGFYQIVALKTDGTLWSWHLLKNGMPLTVAELQKDPVRLGTHADWVAIGFWYDQSVGLAADGAFWQLPSDLHIGFGYDTREPWLLASRRMSKIENIFGGQ